MAQTRRATPPSPDQALARDAQEQVALLEAFLVTTQHFSEGGDWAHTHQANNFLATSV